MDLRGCSCLGLQVNRARIVLVVLGLELVIERLGCL